MNEPKKVIVRNAARCLACGDEVESVSPHDFQACSCGSIFVGGGHAYLRGGAKNPNHFESLAVVKDA